MTCHTTSGHYQHIWKTPDVQHFVEMKHLEEGGFAGDTVERCVSGAARMELHPHGPLDNDALSSWVFNYLSNSSPHPHTHLGCWRYIHIYNLSHRHMDPNTIADSSNRKVFDNLK